jgi:hypothetical protein
MDGAVQCESRECQLHGFCYIIASYVTQAVVRYLVVAIMCIIDSSAFAPVTYCRLYVGRRS